jgi:hypothetical protein
VDYFDAKGSVLGSTVNPVLFFPNLDPDPSFQLFPDPDPVSVLDPVSDPT